jgi:Predicted nucleotide-binding protein containing TIR-like domain/Effector-associated domain 1
MLHLALIELRQILEEVYADTAGARRVAVDSGLDATAIDFTGSARDVWGRVLREAHIAGALVAIVATAGREYPPLKYRLNEALSDYLPFERSPEKSPVVADHTGGAPVTVQHRIQRDKASHRVDGGKGAMVLLVEGRDRKASVRLRGVLHVLGIQAVEWSDAVEWTGMPHPDAPEVLRAAARHVTAIVVLLTGDDESKLRREFCADHERAVEGVPLPQARSGVLVRAAMARALYPTTTVLVQYGRLRPVADLPLPVMLDDSAESFHVFARTLAAAGCAGASAGKPVPGIPCTSQPDPSLPVPAQDDRVWTHAVALLRPLKSFLPFARMGGETEIALAAVIGEDLTLSLRIPPRAADLEVHHWAPGAILPAHVPLGQARRTAVTLEVGWRVAAPAGAHHFDLWARQDPLGHQRLVARGSCVVRER